MPTRTLARHLALLDIHGMNNTCIGLMHMDIEKYLEAGMPKGILRGYRNIGNILRPVEPKGILCRYRNIGNILRPVVPKGIL